MVSTDHDFSKERRVEAESNWGPSTTSQTPYLSAFCFFSFPFPVCIAVAVIYVTAEWHMPQFLSLFSTLHLFLAGNVGRLTW